METSLSPKIRSVLLAYGLGEKKLAMLTMESDIVWDAGIVGDDFDELLPFLHWEFGEFDENRFSVIPDEASQLSVLEDLKGIVRMLLGRSRKKVMSLKELEKICSVSD